jgi:hypothetical protein
MFSPQKKGVSEFDRDLGRSVHLGKNEEPVLFLWGRVPEGEGRQDPIREGKATLAAAVLQCLTGLCASEAQCGVAHVAAFVDSARKCAPLALRATTEYISLTRESEGPEKNQARGRSEPREGNIGTTHFCNGAQPQKIEGSVSRWNAAQLTLFLRRSALSFLSRGRITSDRTGPSCNGGTLGRCRAVAEERRKVTTSYSSAVKVFFSICENRCMALFKTK